LPTHWRRSQKPLPGLGGGAARLLTYAALRVPLVLLVALNHSIPLKL
jgi:hypothetical protein